MRFVLVLLVLFWTGCSLDPNGDEAACSSVDDIPQLVANPGLVVGVWALDHANNHAWTAACRRVSVSGTPMTFFENGTYDRQGLFQGTYSFEQEDGLWRVVLDSSSVPMIRVDDEWLVVDYTPADGLQEVYRRHSSP